LFSFKDKRRERNVVTSDPCYECKLSDWTLLDPLQECGGETVQVPCGQQYVQTLTGQTTEYLYRYYWIDTDGDNQAINDYYCGVEVIIIDYECKAGLQDC
jgi:hypothetical protein